MQNYERSDLYLLPSIIRIIKSKRMRWAGHVARMGEKRNLYRLLVGKLEGKKPLGDQDLGGWIILGWTLERWDGVIGLVWLRTGTGGSSCEYSIEPSGSKNCWETIEWPNKWWPLE
jgi:hypothetical protein